MREKGEMREKGKDKLLFNTQTFKSSQEHLEYFCVCLIEPLHVKQVSVLWKWVDLVANLQAT